MFNVFQLLMLASFFFKYLENIVVYLPALLPHIKCCNLLQLGAFSRFKFCSNGKLKKNTF